MTQTLALIAAAAVVLVAVVVPYNGLVRRRNGIDDASSSIGVVVRHRSRHEADRWQRPVGLDTPEVLAVQALARWGR